MKQRRFGLKKFNYATMQIGLYFGSFNPIHTGHLIIGNHIANSTNLEQVWFIVSPQNPLKQAAGLLNEYHRFHLIKVAIEGENKLKASNVEFTLPKPSYTIDTLVYLEEKYPHHQFSVIMGSDSLVNIEKWKNYKAILKNYGLYVYERPGFKADKLKYENRIQFVNAPLLEISSTMIRKLIKEKKSIRYLVTDAVFEEIQNNGYYR